MCVSTVHDLTYPGPFELHSDSESQPDISSGMSAEFPGPFDCFVSAKYIFEMWAGSLKTQGVNRLTNLVVSCGVFQELLLGRGRSIGR